ncbi:hypothetical protein L596_028000 [Steinernema carpocapsae]|uniref:Uncharacterized protein n=1 Tax=Steinernema carpocapsae TaxID=34508 RepID=A0A4U5LXA4_STECR|nr:hypothetical protein L596_028000 [Steinernema carpocapsae]
MMILGDANGKRDKKDSPFFEERRVLAERIAEDLLEATADGEVDIYKRIVLRKRLRKEFEHGKQKSPTSYRSLEKRQRIEKTADAVKWKNLLIPCENSDRSEDEPPTEFGSARRKPEKTVNQRLFGDIVAIVQIVNESRSCHVPRAVWEVGRKHTCGSWTARKKTRNLTLKHSTDRRKRGQISVAPFFPLLTSSRFAKWNSARGVDRGVEIRDSGVIQGRMSTRPYFNEIAPKFAIVRPLRSFLD